MLDGEIRVMRFWGGVYAENALRNLATLGEEGVVRRSHLKEVQQLYRGTIDFSAFNLNGWAPAAAGRFTLYASTSRDSKFKAQSEINMNNVWAKVREHVEQEELAYPCLVEYKEGEMKCMGLFKDRRAYLAAWFEDMQNVKDVAVGDRQPLLLTGFSFTPCYLGDEDLLVGLGKNAKDDVAVAHRINIVADMLQVVKGRPKDISVKKAVRDWSSGSSYPVHIYDPRLKKWVIINYYAEGSAEDLKELTSRLEDVKEELRESDLVGFEADNIYGAAEMLPKMKQIAVKAKGVIIGDATAAGGDDICTRWGYGCGGVTDLAGTDLAGGQTALVGGGGIFGEMIRAKMDELIGRVDAAIVGNQGISGLTADQKQEIKKLKSEFDLILRAFQSHVGGSLQQIRGELQMLGYRADQADQSVQQNKERFAETQQRLSDIASSLGVLAGQLDYMTPEEEYIAARDLKYSATSRTVEINGRKATGTMVRIIENSKRRYYAWLADLHNHGYD
jgi:uncharacterized protein with GYD domain